MKKQLMVLAFVGLAATSAFATASGPPTMVATANTATYVGAVSLSTGDHGARDSPATLAVKSSIDYIAIVGATATPAFGLSTGNPGSAHESLILALVASPHLVGVSSTETTLVRDSPVLVSKSVLGAGVSSATALARASPAFAQVEVGAGSGGSPIGRQAAFAAQA